jgi:hypothetical protein
MTANAALEYPPISLRSIPVSIFPANGTGGTVSRAAAMITAAGSIYVLTASTTGVRRQGTQFAASCRFAEPEKGSGQALVYCLDTSWCSFANRARQWRSYAATNSRGIEPTMTAYIASEHPL